MHNKIVSSLDTSKHKPQFSIGGDMTWPNPMYAVNVLDWRLRYAPESITREDQLVLASICSAYWALATTTVKRRNEVARMLQNAIDEEAECAQP